MGVRFIVAVFLCQAVLLAYYREFALLNRTMSGLANTVVSLMAQHSARAEGMLSNEMTQFLLGNSKCGWSRDDFEYFLRYLDRAPNTKVRFFGMEITSGLISTIVSVHVTGIAVLFRIGTVTSYRW